MPKQEQDGITIIHAGGTNYALHTTAPEAVKLIEGAQGFLQLQDGNEIIHLNPGAITTIAVWDKLPIHHGRVWQLTTGRRKS